MRGGAIKGAWPLAAAAGVGATMFGVVQLLFPVSDATKFDAGYPRYAGEPPPRVFNWPEPPRAQHEPPRAEPKSKPPVVVAEAVPPPYTDNVLTSTGAEQPEAPPPEPETTPPTEPE